MTNPGPAPTAVASATRSEVRQVVLRDQPTAGANGTHGERLSLGGRTLGVFRPELASGPQRTLTVASASMQKSAELVASRAAQPAVGNEPQLAGQVPAVEREAGGVAGAVPASRNVVVIDQPAAVRTETPQGQPAYVVRNHSSKQNVNQNPRGQVGAYPQLQTPPNAQGRNTQPEANVPGIQQRPMPEPASRPAEVRTEAPRTEAPRYVPPPEPPHREAAPPPAPAAQSSGRGR